MDYICNDVLSTISLHFHCKMAATVGGPLYASLRPKLLKAYNTHMIWHCMIVYMLHPIYNQLPYAYHSKTPTSP